MTLGEIVSHPMAVTTMAIAIVGVAWRIGVWMGAMNEHKNQVVEAVAELKTDLKEYMAEVRRDFKEIARRLDGSPVESQSPLRLSEKGGSISDKLKAKQWAKSTAPELADRLTGKTRCEIQEACFERASTDAFEENAEMTRGILDCAAPGRTRLRMSSVPYDFGTGRSDPATFPAAGLKAAALRVLEREGESFSDHPGLRQAMAARETEREGVAVNPERPVITNGCMQAVTLTEPGDAVLPEECSHPGTLSAHRSLKLDLVGIPLDEGGMRLDAAADALTRLQAAGRTAKFIYAISTCQNPTGLVMPKQRRGRL